MKKLTKRFLSFMVMACLVFFLTACGGNDDGEDPSSDPAAQSDSGTSADNEASNGESDLENYVNSDAMQTVFDTLKEQYESQGITTEIYAEGNELRYEFTMNDLETTEEDRELYEQILKESLEGNEDAFIDTAVQAKEAVSNDVVVVVVTYLDGAGNVLYTQSYSSEDAE